jgi:hypothetical protein
LYLDVVEKSLVLVNTEAARKQTQKALFDNLHLTLHVDGLEVAEQIARLGLLIQIDDADGATEQLGQMLQRCRLAHARLTAQQHRLVALDAYLNHFL